MDWLVEVTAALKSAYMAFFVGNTEQQTMLQQFFHSVFITFAAFAARLMWHVKQVQLERRKFWSYHLIWELIVAYGMGMFADGVTSYMDLTGPPAVAVVVTASYLGPRGLETFAQRLYSSKKT